MIDVFICEENENDSVKIKDGCTEYYINQNYDSEIYECKNSDELIEKVNDYELSAVYFLDCSEITDLMIERLQQSAKGSYLILMADNMKKILDTISPNIRPSGYLLLPADKEVIKDLINNKSIEPEGEINNEFYTD